LGLVLDLGVGIGGGGGAVVVVGTVVEVDDGLLEVPPTRYAFRAL
jgi:hypothetical protein